MSSLLPFVMTAMTFLAPGRDHFELATAIADEVEAVDPLFANDEDRRRTAATVLAVAFREGSLRLRVEGDCTKSAPGAPCQGTPRAWCTMQVALSVGARTSEGWSGPDLRDDPRLCIRKGLSMLRVSAGVDRLNPVAEYARGPRYATEEAKRISRDRMALAARTLVATNRVMKEIGQ